MHEWEDETLVAIETQADGRYKVLELPARQVRVIRYHKLFTAYEKAEEHIADQYSRALTVQCEDIDEEQRRRASTSNRRVSR